MTRAVAAGFERLESRQLFSAAALTIGGAPSPVDEGSSYSLNLSVSNLPSGTNVTDYSITWGDGQVTPITGAAATNPLVVNHTYLDGPALNLNVTATATLSDAEVLNSNTGSSTVTSDGSPDAAFGAGGTADTTLGLGAVTNNVAVQSNGQLVVAGVHGSTMSLVRLNSDGSVDGTFNLANPSLGVGTSSVARVLIETDPSDSSRTDYLVAGTVGSNGVLWRIHADDGTPDASFGIGGKLTLGTTQTLDDATLDPNGNIVTLGMHGDTVTATRLLADGSLDATFAGGEQTYAYDFTGSAYGVVATSDSVVAVTNGFTWVTGDTLSHLLKFTNAGLAGDAILQTNPSGPFSPSMHFDAIAMDANGNYVLGGRNLGGPSTASFAVARFDSNLNPDSSFGSGGFVTTTAVGQGGGATGIAVGADGKIVAVGVRSAAGQSVLARYDNTGLLDPSFGSGGIVLAGPSAGFVTPEAVVVQPDLKVLVPIIDASFTGPAGIVVRLGNSSNATSTPVTVNVNNVAPTPSINVAPSSGSEGTAISLSGSVTDPSPVDTAAGLGLAWSVTKNGLAYGGGGSGANFSFTPDDNGAYVVTLTATDKDGGSSSTDTPITVANVNPSTGAITSPAAAVRGQNVSFASSFTDPGVLDSHTVTWDFGDSSPAVTSSVGAGVTGAVSASHAFTSAGTFNVTLTVTDNDGGSGSSSKSFTVDIVDIQG
ncbi:MAG TPA: PKD domain-containing protein, partial [Tepidisphaeraceae bacterium]|nr:PKD domain-containing protein [Tepidisphaeraceae bacterium]